MYTQTTSHIILDTTNNNNIFPCVRVYVYLYVYVSSFVHQCATYEKMFCYDIMPKLDTKVQISDSIFSFVFTPNNSFLYLTYISEKFFGFVQYFSIRKNQPKLFHLIQRLFCLKIVTTKAFSRIRSYRKLTHRIFVIFISLQCKP